MLRMAKDETGNDRIEIWRVEGRVVGKWVWELRLACDRVLAGTGRRLVLDLRNVSFIDADGIALFHELASRNVALVNCSLFAAEQLRDLIAS
jgi:anti-anti-sigma regulatory factor